MPCALRPPRRTIKTKFPEVEGKCEASGKLMVRKKTPPEKKKKKNSLQMSFLTIVFSQN